MNQKFTDFIKKEGVYKKFMSRFYDEHKHTKFELYATCTKPSYLILGAFVWINFDLWLAIDTKWQKELKK